jgi:hypothetical protein
MMTFHEQTIHDWKSTFGGQPLVRSGENRQTMKTKPKRSSISVKILMMLKMTFQKIIVNLGAIFSPIFFNWLF